jgi:hypothetical protein
MGAGPYLAAEQCTTAAAQGPACQHDALDRMAALRAVAHDGRQHTDDEHRRNDRQ